MQIKQNKLQLSLMALLSISLVSLSLAPSVHADCAGVATSLINCDGKDGVMGLLKLAVNILTAGIGIAAVGAVVYAGILYTTSAGSSDQTKKALEMIRNVAIGIIAYALMYILLNFIIPGGVVPL